MFSRFLKFIVPPFTFRVFFRRIFYSNLKKVPLDKPLLFAGNHQNSFMDGVLVGAYLPQPIHFLMRADMFRNPLASFCLNQLNVSPAYRVEEGLENVHKNLETFKGIYKILRKNGNYIVFSEGICVQEKRLQKLRKGTARMAFGAAEEFGLDVHVIPVGINYTYPARFRQEVMINFHEPFSIKELQELYKISPAKALLVFNQRIEKGLEEEVIIVGNPGNDLLVEQLHIMVRNNHILPFFKWRFDSDERRLLEKEIAEKINHLDKTSGDSLNSLSGKVRNYGDILRRSKIKDENVARKLDWGWLRYLSVILGFPVFIAGYLCNLIPFVLPKLICNIFIKDLRFYSSVYIGIGTLLYLIYFPLIVLLGILTGGWIGFFTGLFVPVMGYLVLFYQEVAIERFHSFRFSLKKISDPSLIEKLKRDREEIMSEMKQININSDQP
jgi:1-acyl-sn-glycerol-3-phosphate acyltransferase